MSDETKFCSRCGRDVPIIEWYRNRATKDGLSSYCRVCQLRANAKADRRRRYAAIETMGGRCVGADGAGCPWQVTDFRVLQFDHINGGGRSDKADRTSSTFFKTVVRFPDRYQLLCANCNLIKRIERGEHIGARVYERVPPTQRLVRSQSKSAAALRREAAKREKAT